MNEIICCKQSQQKSISSLTDNNNNVTDRYTVSNLLNNYFTNVGPNMDSKIPKAIKSFQIPGLAKSFMFDLIAEAEVSTQFQQLNPNKAPGPENIPIKFLKPLATIISPYLCKIFNKCFE